MCKTKVAAALVFGVYVLISIVNAWNFAAKSVFEFYLLSSIVNAWNFAAKSVFEFHLLGCIVVSEFAYWVLLYMPKRAVAQAVLDNSAYWVLL